MLLSHSRYALVSLMLSLGGTLACGDSPPEGPSDKDSGAGNPEDSDGGQEPAKVDFKAQLIDAVKLTAAPGFKVVVLDNETGAPLPGIEPATSGDDGDVEFKGLPAGLVGFKVVGTPGAMGFVDVFQFGFDASAQSETLRSLSRGVSDLVESQAMFEAKAEFGSVSGAFYWVDDKGVETPIGCATVKVEGDEDNDSVRYFGEKLPVARAVRTTSNPLNGRFFVGNVTPGPVTLVGYLDGKEIGRMTYPASAREDSDVGSSTAISNIYYQGDKNPTPAGCK